MTRSKCHWLVYAGKLPLLSGAVFLAHWLTAAAHAQASDVHNIQAHNIFQHDSVLLGIKVLSYICIFAASVILFICLNHYVRNRKEHSNTLKGSEEFEKVSEKLREREKQFHLLVSGIKDYAIFMLDPAGKIVTWNEGAEHIKGYKAAEVIGKSFSHFFLPEDKGAGKPSKILELASKYGKHQEEALLMRKDGSRFWAYTTLTALRDPSGQLTGFVKVTRDVTEQKQVIQTLEEQAALFDLFNDAIIVRNLDGTIRYWNAGAEKMYGYLEQEVLEKKTHDLLKTESETSLSQIQEDVLAKGHWEGELIHYRKDGRRIIVESRQALKTGAERKPTGIVEINTDVTNRKEAEERQLALAEMERVNSELQQFAYIASHDLQEPLRAVASCLQILEKTYKGQLGEKADELIHFAVDGAVRMRTLINDLLVLSKVDSEQMNFSRTDLREVLKQVKTNLAAAIEESGATISDNQLPVLYANNTLLAMLFQNLISNAIKFRNSTAPQIVIGATRQNGNWLFSVSDNGIGFEQKYAAHIFQPFKRLHSKADYPGTGIGLPICKRIVERHGGKIWAESQPGKGTTFYFTISEVLDNKKTAVA